MGRKAVSQCVFNDGEVDQHYTFSCGIQYFFDLVLAALLRAS